MGTVAAAIMLRRACTMRFLQHARLAPVIRAPGIIQLPLTRPLAIKVDSSSHSDFAPQSNEEVPASINERIAQDIEADDVVLYMKGIPSAPQCGFSNAVVRVLEAEGVTDYAAYNVLDDQLLRQGI